MSEKRRGLGRGIGALIPSGPGQSPGVARPIDVFFGSTETAATSDEPSGAVKLAVAQSPVTAGPEVEREETDRTRAETPQHAPAVSWDEPATNGAGIDETVDAVTDDAVDRTPVSTDEGDGGATADQEVPSEATDRAENRGGTPTAEGPADPPGEADGLVPVPGATFAEIPVDAITPNTRQPRQVFDEEELEELAASIREVGVLQPVVVRRVREQDASGAAYELIMGERRWRASQLAGNGTVPAIVRDTGDTDLLRDALLENLHRTQLNPLEEAAAYQQLLEDFGCTHDELAARIARSRPQISNTLRLLKLPPLVQRRVAAGVLSAGHARALLGLADGAAMERLAQRIVAEGLSVRATEEIVALGDEPVQPELRRRPRLGAHSETLDRVASRLTDHLDTRVKVTMGQRKGRIAIEFAGIDDLDRILRALGEQPLEEAAAP